MLIFSNCYNNSSKETKYACNDKHVFENWLENFAYSETNLSLVQKRINLYIH